MTYLLKELNDCKLKLSNRLVFPPMATAKSDVDGKSIALLHQKVEQTKDNYL